MTKLESIRESIAFQLQEARRLENDALADIKRERKAIRVAMRMKSAGAEQNARSRLACHYADLHESRGKIEALTQCMAATF